jgi:hypothetical protein
MRAARRLASLPLVILVACLAAPPAQSAWPSDPAVNVPLCTAAADQDFPRIVADGAGGAIAVWSDHRDTLVSRTDVFAQRVSAGGVPQWTANGVAICTEAHEQFNANLVPDGAGGAIIAWLDGRAGNYQVYAQRVNAGGVPQWTPDGVAVCAASASVKTLAIVPDGAGGAILAWADGRSGGFDLYAQRVNAAGVSQWSPDGVALCTAAGEQSYPSIAPDGAGGAIVTWQDIRSGASYDIYAQSVSAAGVPQWTVDGVAVCALTGYQQLPVTAPDGGGGAFIAWQDGRLGSDYDIYVQRLNAFGAPQWSANGQPLCVVPGQQFFPKIIGDGGTGAIVVWEDDRFNISYDIYAQRVDAAGVAQWTASGVALCADPGYQSSSVVTSDGAGGAIVSWEDNRAGILVHIYARRVNAAGTALWTTDGVVLCTAPIGQFSSAIASNGSGGAIVTWDDVRNGAGRDIYAQQIEADGTLGGDVAAAPSPPLASLFGLQGAQPNPAAGDLRVSFSLPDASPASLDLLDLSGRRIESRYVGSYGFGAHVVSLTPRSRALRPGVYWVRLTQGTRMAMTKVAVLQ